MINDEEELKMRQEELIKIITKFAECGWDLIDAPSKEWLEVNRNEEVSEAVTAQLIAAVEKADQECGSCGCEFDPLYKRALALLSAT
ncbi:MAG: hypothetical protein K0S47_3589 [Herbinix sp.]|jgi:hypothetical protein|nr:hypothetical protein [Herbinix sp.]